MKQLKKIWSLTAICGMIIGIFPMTIFAETITAASVVINQAEITTTEDQAITEDNPIKHKATVKTKLSWSLDQAALIDEGTLTAVNLPANLNFPDQAGSLGEMGNYQVSNQQLLFQFNKNYQETEDGRAPDFASAKFYEGVVELTAETTAEDVETETVDFGNNLVSTLYYDKKVDPAADPLEATEAAKKFQPQTHNPSLNERGVNLFNDIQITDLDGNAFTEANPAVKDANINIHFNWSLDDDENILDGDTYTYQLPEYFSVHNIVKGDLYNDTSKLVMGTFYVDQIGKMTVTFNATGTNLSERQGTITLSTELNVTEDKEEIKIETDITDQEDQKITIYIPIAKGDIHKAGIIAQNNSITWTITANRDRRNLKNAVITDYFPDGLNLWYVNYYLQEEDGTWTKSEDFEYKQKDEKTFEFRYIKEELNVPVKIEVNATVADTSQKEFVNHAKIEGSNFITNSTEASVSIDEKDNFKKLLNYNLSDGIFNWEVKSTFTQSGGILKDWMYNKVEADKAVHFLKKETLQVFYQDGKEVPNDDWEFVTTPASEFKQKNGEYVHFTLKFKNPGVYTIKYSTEAFEKPVKPGTEVGNLATVIDGEHTEELIGGEIVKVSEEIGVGKRAEKKNYTNSTVDYVIDFNTEKVMMNNAVIIDRFERLNGRNKNAQQLVESTLKLTTASGVILTKGEDYILENLAGDPEYKTGFKITLINAYARTNEVFKMIYTAKYFVHEQPKEDDGLPSIRFDNSVTVSFTDNDGKEHLDGAETAFWLDIKLTYNGLKQGVFVSKDTNVAKKLDIYNLNPFSDTTAPTDSVYWSAIFNLWNRKLPENTTIREALGEGQKKREIVIYDIGISDSTAKINKLDYKWELEKDYTIIDDNGVPVIKLLKEKTKMFAIFVSADASEEVYKYKNVATMTIPGEEPLKIEGIAEKSDKDDWLDKSGQQGTGDDYRLINWSVVLNKDGHKVVQPYIEDTIDMADQTFVYDADKNVLVKVYKAKDDGKGGFEKDGEAIVFDEENRPVVTTDLAEGTQTLTIKLGDSINSPYIIEYQTMLDPDIGNNEKVSNKAILFGKDVYIHETSKEVVVKSTNGEGTSSGKNGSLEFRKLDENKELIITDSAFFDFYRKDKEGNLTLMLSNIEVKGDKIIEDGTEVDNLSKLRYGKYVVVESKAPDGYVKDDTKYEFEIDKDHVEYTFTLENKRESNSLDTKIELAAQKELSGRPLEKEEFSFNLKGDGVDQTVKNDEDGKIIFDEIYYLAEGTHEYTISEIIPSEKETGITYDETKYKVTVTVEEKAGKLEASVDYENVKVGEVPVFKNAYKALPTSIKLEAKKELEGRKLKNKEFSFSLKGDNVDQTKQNDLDGKVEFAEINYDQAGTYEYTISEVIPSEKETGITYDETKYKVTVTVEEKAGKLEATVVYENVKASEVPVFKNTYKALPTSIKLEAKKELAGRELKNEEFSFSLKGNNVDQTKKNNIDGKIEFDEITYSEEGVHEYTISEVIPSEKETGITYDETKYKVTVTVEEKAGKLEAAAVYENVKTGEVPVFKNAYKALPTSIKLEAKKELEGRKLKNEEFSFSLKGDNVDQTKQNDLDGKVEFAEINYDQAGTYEYTISEVIPSEKETGITYDETKYKVTVTVEEKAGKLEATVAYENVKAGEVPVFKNAYKVLPTSIKLEAKKELEGRKLKNEEFSFNLKGDNVDQTKQNDLDGKVEFDEITYSEEGTHEYTISEVIPSEKETGITYDEMKYKVTVTVEEKAGKLEATVAYENVKAGEVPVFKNAYKALPTSIKLEAKKELEGRKLKNEEFSFNLKGDNVDQTKQNDLDGKVEFDEITYSEEGTHEYTISEVIPSEKETGITYDETKYKVTVTVEEKAGKLEATAVYENVKDGEVPIFKNTYKVLPTSIKLEAQKELSGRELKNKEFSFNLKGDDLDQTVKNDENGKVAFAEINYTKADTYNYTISEVIPEEKNPTITYDDTEYKVIVTVAEKAGKLEASVDYENVKANEVPIFKNLFTPEKKVPTGEILLKKVDSKTGKTLADAEFKLVDGKDQPVAGHEKIVTSADGTIFIKGLTDGNYQLIETKAPKGYQLDETPIEFTVKNSQPSKKEIKKENTRINLPDTGDSSDPKTNNAATNTHTTYRNGSASSSATSKRLPSTGSVRSNGLIILGLFFLAMIALVVFGKRKKV